MYYRQAAAAAAAAATLQKPLPYRLYPPALGLSLPGPSSHLNHLATNFYSATATNVHQSPRHSTDSPVDPGTPPTPQSQSQSKHANRMNSSDDEDEQIQV